MSLPLTSGIGVGKTVYLWDNLLYWMLEQKQKFQRHKQGKVQMYFPHTDIPVTGGLGKGVGRALHQEVVGKPDSFLVP